MTRRIGPGVRRDDGSHGPRFPDRPVRRFRSGDDPPDVLRLRHFRRWYQLRAGTAQWAISARRRANHSALRGRGLKTVSIPDPNQDRHRRLLLGIAGPAVRRSGGIDGVGEGCAGRRRARGVEKATQGEEGGQEESGKAQGLAVVIARSSCDEAIQFWALDCFAALAMTEKPHATWLWISAVYSGSASQITR